MGCKQSTAAVTAPQAAAQQTDAPAQPQPAETAKTVSELTPEERALNQLKLIFESIDANSDGAVSKLELATALTADGNLGALIKDAGFNPNYTVLEQLDSNKDGLLSWIEFEGHLKSQAVIEVKKEGDLKAAELPAEQRVMNALEKIFKSIDADDNGAVDKAELERRLNDDKDDNGLMKDGSFGQLCEEAKINPGFKTFEKLDTDSDGKITWEEFQKHLRAAATEEVKELGEVAAAEPEAIIEAENKQQGCGCWSF